MTLIGEEQCFQSKVPMIEIMKFLNAENTHIESSSVIVRCSNGVLAVNKLVLASISPMLCSAMKGISSESIDSILIPDFTTDQISKYLNLVCQGKDLSTYSEISNVIGYDPKFVSNSVAEKTETIFGNEIKVEEKVDGDDNNDFEYVDDYSVCVYDEKRDDSDADDKIHPNVINFQSKEKKIRINPIKPYKHKSKVWNHFTRDPNDKDKKKCICNHCDRIIISGGGSTTSMLGHLKKFHPDFIKKSTLTLEQEETSPIEEPVLDPESGELLTKEEQKMIKKKSIIKKGFTRVKTSFVWNHFKQDPDDPQMAVCEICSKSIYNNSTVTAGLIRHLQHHGIYKNNNPLPCSVCGLMFENQYKRQKHEYNHKRQEELKFKCSFCQKGFASNHIRRKHEMCHTGEKPYQVKREGPSLESSSNSYSYFYLWPSVPWDPLTLDL